MTVHFEDTMTSLEVIIQALNKVGYTVGEPEEIKE
jgi:hypothetical protein